MPYAARGRTGRPSCRCPPGVLALAAGLFFLIVALGPPAVAQPSGYRGRFLVEVLREIQNRGVELIFSTAVVSDDLVITVEPSAVDARALLDEILEPLGLEAQDGPAGSILIIRPQRGAGPLRGRVLLAGRGTPIAGAAVRLLDTGLEAYSGPDGSFEILRVPPGNYRMEVGASGFSTATLAGVRVPPEADRILTVELTLESSLVTEIVVTPGRHSVVQEPQTQLTVERADAVLVPTIGGDVTRVIELLPGVTAPDNSAAFNVRGSAARDYSIVLDGLELYDPFHLNGFQSPFTLIDGKIVDRIDLFTGGFTAELGDRHGGFVEISTVAPPDDRHGELELGTLNSRVSYQAPLWNRSASWLLSVRAWYPEALRDSIELGGGERVDPRFGDAYSKLFFAVSPRTLLSVHSLFSYDRLSFTERPTEKDGESADALTRNGYLWVRALSSWTSDVTSETALSGGRIERQRVGFSVPQENTSTVDDDRTVNFFGFKHDSIWRISSAHALKAGAEARRLSARYRYENRLVNPPGPTTRIALDPDGTSISAYLSHRARVSPTLTTEVGLRWDRQSYTVDNQLSPRFNALWRIGERSELRLGLGRFNQSQRIHELHVEDGETSFSPAEVSEQLELTFQHRFPGGLQLRMDGYYRELSSLRPRYENLFAPIELFPETGEDRVRISPQGARLRGTEFLLRGDSGDPLTWWVSYALSSAEDDIDGYEVPRSWDQTHALKFLVGHQWGEKWSVSLAGTTHTGWPTTPVSGELATLLDGTMAFQRVLGPRNSDRFPTYARLDVKGRRSFSGSQGRLWLILEVVNLTDRKNVCCVDEFVFAPRPDGSVEVERGFDHWLGITPSLSLLWEF